VKQAEVVRQRRSADWQHELSLQKVAAPPSPGGGGGGKSKVRG